MCLAGICLGHACFCPEIVALSGASVSTSISWITPLFCNGVRCDHIMPPCFRWRRLNIPRIVHSVLANNAAAASAQLLLASG
eukprot:COSAG01_NODE_2783_length_7084_cov_242.792269_3_plen_82_part_00